MPVQQTNDICDLCPPPRPLTLDDEAKAEASQRQEGEDVLLARLQGDIGGGRGHAVTQAEGQGQLC